MNKIKLKNVMKNIILIAFLFVYIVSICHIELQNDTFFDIALGKEYSLNGIYEIDNFSMHEGLIYHTHHFLSSLIIFKTYDLFGFLGLHILEIFITCIIAALFYILNNRFVKNKMLAYFFVFLELFMFAIFISLRAQMFSTIIFLIEILLINKYLYDDISKKLGKGILIILILLPLLLINFHGGVIFFYYIIIMVYLCNLLKIKLIKIENDKTINKSKLKKLFLVIFISLPFLFINPYGLSGITYMFKTLNNSFINSNIQEFQPFNIKTQIGLYMFIYFIIHILTLILSSKKIKIHEILFFMGTIFMSLLSIRHFIFYIIVTVVLLPHIEDILIKLKGWLYKGLVKNGPKAMKITIYSILSIYIFMIIVQTLKSKEFEFIPNTKYPVSAVEYVKENIGNDKRIFNKYSWGSYMIFNGIKVFIDSRCDLYTKEYNLDVTVAEDYINTVRCKVYYEDIVKKYDIEYFLLSKEEVVSNILINDDNYEKIYEDELAYIFKKK